MYPNMCAKFGCGPRVVSKKRGVRTVRQTNKTAALYSRPAGYPASLGRGRRGEGGRRGGGREGREEEGEGGRDGGRRGREEGKEGGGEGVR